MRHVLISKVVACRRSTKALQINKNNKSERRKLQAVFSLFLVLSFYYRPAGNTRLLKMFVKGFLPAGAAGNYDDNA